MSFNAFLILFMCAIPQYAISHGKYIYKKKKKRRKKSKLHSNSNNKIEREMRILVHYVYIFIGCDVENLRQKLELKLERLCHESNDHVTSLATRHSNVTKTF